MLSMLKKLIRGESLIRHSYGETYQMMDLVADLYDQAVAYLLDQTQPSLDIHKEDKRVNHLEMQIRGDILRHFAVNPQVEVSSALILSFVIGYVERVGDYAKNIEELAQMYSRPLRATPDAAALVTIAELVGVNIRKTRDAFAREDRHLAIAVIKDHKRVRKTCNATLEAAFAAEDISRDALVCAMLARYLKRTSAGLKNICTAIVAPYDQVGYTRQLELSERRGES